MVTAAPVRAAAPSPTPRPAPPVRPPAARARLIPVAAYPAGVPRWVTYEGRRHRVVAVHEQPALTAALPPGLPRRARPLRVELADGRTLTLLHDRGAWYHGDG
jgi:hypothetical protein